MTDNTTNPLETENRRLKHAIARVKTQRDEWNTQWMNDGTVITTGTAAAFLSIALGDSDDAQ